MRQVTFIIMAVTAFVLQAWACLGPTNIEGVAFTSGETLNLPGLTAMGVENVNYFRDGDTTAVGIRYKSHYDPRAMVFVGNYGLSYQRGIRMVCMGVILPLPDTADVYAPIDRETFDFAVAVRTELEWLASNGIVAITAETITVFDSLEKTGSAGNGSMQYWTHAATMLGYNSWYNYDTVTGTWQGNDGVYGVNGVRTPDETQGLSGCSVIKPGVGVPPQGLGTTAIAYTSTAVLHTMQPLMVRHLGNGGLVVFLQQQATLSGLEVAVFNFRGVVVCKKQIHTGMKSVHINGLAPGRYHARLMK